MGSPGVVITPLGGSRWVRCVATNDITTVQLVNELVEAADERVLSRVVGHYGRLDLGCLNELGYVQIDPRGAELLLAERVGPKSVQASGAEDLDETRQQLAARDANPSQVSSSSRKRHRPTRHP